MRNLAILVMLLSAISFARCQNLVPNPSFEDTARCHMYDPIRTSAPPWFNPNTATPDIYDNNLDRQCGVPWDPNNPDVQASGWQYAHTGTRFTGAYHWDGPGPENSDVKEYVMVPLIQLLQAGQAYEASLYYSRADGFYYAIDRISMYFSADSIHVDHPWSIPVQPQVDLFDPGHPYLDESQAWIQLADTFVAAGTERYLLIGSFLDSAHVNAQQVSGQMHYAYYYYDDVSVRPVEIAEGTHSFQVIGMTGSSIIYRWVANEPLEWICVVDQLGRTIMSEHVSRDGIGTVRWPTGIVPGTYTLIAANRNTRKAVRIVREQ